MVYHIYVIELSPSVQQERRWYQENPQQETGESYYVGQTKHSPECRFEQHVTRRGAPYQCIPVCSLQENVSPYAVGRARFAADYAVTLRPDLCEGLGPFATRDDAENAERNLTSSLQEDGHGAYSR